MNTPAAYAEDTAIQETEQEWKKFGVESSRRTLVPDPEAPATPYETTVEFDKQAGVYPVTHAKTATEPPSPLTPEQELAQLDEQEKRVQERKLALSDQLIRSAVMRANGAVGDLIKFNGHKELGALASQLQHYVPEPPAKTFIPSFIPTTTRATHQEPPEAKPVVRRGRPPKVAKAVVAAPTKRGKPGPRGAGLTNGDLISKVLHSFDEPQHIKVIYPLLEQEDGWTGSEGNARSTLAQLEKQDRAKNVGHATWILTKNGHKHINEKLAQQPA